MTNQDFGTRGADGSDTSNGGNGAQNPAGDATQMKGMPIFYEQPEILDPERHKGLGLIDSQSLSFAASSNAIPLNAAEFSMASRDYPIVFVGEEDINSVAIVGLKNDENLMVDKDGNWARGAYIPAYVRRYPFIFVHQAGTSQYALCIDRASSRISSDGETAFFDGAEKTELSEKAMEFCTLYQRHHIATEAVLKQLGELDLLVTHSIQFPLGDGNSMTLKDFRIVDEKRLQELSDDDFLKLRKSGALAAIYCHLVSLNSWQNLLQRAVA